MSVDVCLVMNIYLLKPWCLTTDIAICHSDCSNKKQFLNKLQVTSLVTSFMHLSVMHLYKIGILVVKWVN